MDFAALLAEDARQAWISGAVFYTSDVSDVAGETEATVNEGSVIVMRNHAWEEALTAITAEGWRLHTWMPMSEQLSGRFPMKIRTMRALFVRPMDS